MRRQVHQAFEQMQVLRAPRAAIDFGRHGVGQRAPRPDMDRRRAVGTRKRRRVQRRRNGAAAAGVCAQIGRDLRLKREEPPVGVERQRRVRHPPAPLIVGKEPVAPRPDPADRPPQRARRPQQQRLFATERILDPETAADIFDDNAEAVFGHPEDLCEFAAQRVRHLRRAAQGEAPARGVPRADGGAGFERGDDDARIRRAKPDPVRRRRHRRPHGGGVAGLPVEAQIAGDAVPQLRRVGSESLRRVDDRRAFDDIAPDEFGGRLRRRLGLGDDHGDGVPHEAHPVFGEQGLIGEDRRFAVAPLRARDDRKRPERAVEVGGGPDPQHPRRSARRGAVDRTQLPMRDIRADEPRMGHPPRRHVGDEAPGAREQAPVFLAPQRLADAEPGHGLPRAATGRISASTSPRTQ